MFDIKHGDATQTHLFFEHNSMDLGIFDPPFGIKESEFDKHYNRKNKVISGYIEAPSDYYKFTCEWLSSVIKVMKEDSAIYIISGWTNLEYILTAARLLALHLENHIIWKYNFGVFTKNKYVSSHYHILYYRLGNPTFNTYARYTQFDKTDTNKSALYEDLEDVWIINKEYHRGQIKNINKLPDSLIRKIILYSSKPGDAVLDVFQGNFTTAINAIRLGRNAYGLELNEHSYNIGIENLAITKRDDSLLIDSKQGAPLNQGKPITHKEREEIKSLVCSLRQTGMTKKQSIEKAMLLHQRGYFSILNIVNK